MVLGGKEVAVHGVVDTDAAEHVHRGGRHPVPGQPFGSSTTCVVGDAQWVPAGFATRGSSQATR